MKAILILHVFIIQMIMKIKTKINLKINLKKQVAFLKCTVDQNVYYAPQIEKVDLKVGGIKTREDRLVTLPKQVLDPETDKLVYTHGYVL